MKFLLIFLMTAAALCTLKAISRFLDYAKDRSYYSKVKAAARAPDFRETEAGSAGIDWDALRDTDIVAWLVLDDRINYPVMQGEDNVFYLSHRPDKSYSAGGSIFLQAENDRYFRDKNSILYGHHMFDGSMFDHLMDYKDQSYRNHRLVLYLPDGTRMTCRLFAVNSVDWDPDYYQYLFGSEQAFLDYQKKLKKNSLYETGTGPSVRERLITLSTCDGPHGTSHRMLLTFQIEKVQNLEAAAS